MPRIKKDPTTKKSRKLITLPQSFADWVTSHAALSTGIQLEIAGSILGTDVKQFTEDLYSDSLTKSMRSHFRDSMDQEFIRMARWIRESIIEDCLVKNDGSVVLFKVRWLLTNKTVWVKTHVNTGGFIKVIYDDVMHEGIEGLSILDGIWCGEPDYQMYPERKEFEYFRLYCMHNDPKGKELNRGHFAAALLLGLSVGLKQSIIRLSQGNPKWNEENHKLYYIDRWFTLSCDAEYGVKQ